MKNIRAILSEALSFAWVVLSRSERTVFAARQLLWHISATLFVLLAYSGDVHSSPWETLDDGRRVIVFKGVRLAPSINPSDVKISYVRGYEQPLEQLSFEDVLRNPDRTRAAFERWTSFSFTFSVASDGDGLFLGKFDRSDLISFGGSISISPDRYWLCDQSDEVVRTYKQLALSSGRITPSGWITFDKRSAGNSVFIRPPAEQPDDFGGMFCDQIGLCGSSKCFADNVLFSFHFNPNRIPEERWLALSHMAAEIAKKLITNVRER